MERMVKFGGICAAGLVALVLAAGTARAAEVYIGKPHAGDYRVDICLEWGMQCAGEAAGAWCKSQGFDRAVEWETEADIGAQEPTVVLGNGQVCAESYCDGYFSIVCAREDAWTQSSGQGGLLVELSRNSQQSPQGILVIAVAEADPSQATAAVVDEHGLALLHTAPGSWRLFAVNFNNAQSIPPLPGMSVDVPPGKDGGFATLIPD